MLYILNEINFRFSTIIEINKRNSIQTDHSMFTFQVWLNALIATFSCILRTTPDDAEAGIRKSSFGAKETSSMEKHFRSKKRVTIMSIEFSRLLLLYCRLDFFSLRFVWLCCLVSPVKWNNLSHCSSMPFRVVSLRNSPVTHYLESTRKMRKVFSEVTQVSIFSKKSRRFSASTHRRFREIYQHSWILARSMDFAKLKERMFHECVKFQPCKVDSNRTIKQ